MSDIARISIQYGGVEYSVGRRRLDDVIAEIEAGVASDAPAWLEVSTGGGRSTPARLLLGRGIPIAVWAINADGKATPTETL